jgi:hypothetical protein
MGGACSNCAEKTMVQKTEDLKQTLILQPSLLSFESERDYRRLDEAIRNHISPRDILEEMWTSEIIEGEWERARLRRYKGQFVKLAKGTAVRNLLNSICADADEAEIANLARDWFTDETTKEEVNMLLNNVDLDESAVDVEAYRLSMPHLMDLDRRLKELALRRDQIFRQIEDYRAGLAARPGSPPRDQDLGIERSGDA